MLVSVKSTRITAGALEDFHLTEIAQLLSLGGKTACVTLDSDGREGRVWFHDGAIVHARCGIWRGEEVLYQLLRWRSGRFFIEHGSTTARRTIDKDTMYLLMEGLRREDEGGRTERAQDRERGALTRIASAIFGAFAARSGS